MPEQFPESWEYFVPDPEIAEAAEEDEYMPTICHADGENAGWGYEIHRRTPDSACDHCGNRFVSHRSRAQRFCSISCFAVVREASTEHRERRAKLLAERPEREVECRFCHGLFLTQWPRQVYCGKVCSRNHAAANKPRRMVLV